MVNLNYNLFIFMLNIIIIFILNKNWLDNQRKKIPLKIENLSAKPADLNEGKKEKSDKRTLEKLINNIHLTTDEKNMWAIPFKRGNNHYLYIKF